mgnify:FL=1
MGKTKITLYDILIMCGQDDLVDIVYNGYKVVVCKPAGDLCDLLEVLDDEILNALVFRINDDYGKIVIHCTEQLKGKIGDYE